MTRKTNDEDELIVLARDKEYGRVFNKAINQLEKHTNQDYRYEIDIKRTVPLLRSFIFVSRKVYDEARAETIKKIRAALADYMQSEGCDCCRDDKNHEKAAKKLAELLNVPKQSAIK